MGRPCKYHTPEARLVARRASRTAHARRERARNPEIQLQRWRKWYATHTAYARARVSKYSKSHRLQVLLANSKYRAIKLSATGSCSWEQLQARIAYYSNRCWVPGCYKNFEAIDHAIPLSRGGSSWPSNLRPICKHRNSSKGNRSWRLWVSRGR